MAHAQHFLHVMKPDVQGCRKPSCLRCPTFFWLLVQPEQQSFSCLLADLGAHPEIKFQTVALQVCASHSISAGCCAWCLVDLQHPSFHWGHAPGARLAALANTQVIHTPKAVCKLNSAEILLPSLMHAEANCATMQKHALCAQQQQITHVTVDCNNKHHSDTLHDLANPGR